MTILMVLLAGLLALTICLLWAVLGAVSALTREMKIHGGRWQRLRGDVEALAQRAPSQPEER